MYNTDLVQKSKLYDIKEIFHLHLLHISHAIIIYCILCMNYPSEGFGFCYCGFLFPPFLLQICHDT